MGINEANFFSLFSTLSIRTELTVFFYQSEVKESSGMLNIHFGLALIDTLDLLNKQGPLDKQQRREAGSFVDQDQQYF